MFRKPHRKAVRAGKLGDPAGCKTDLQKPVLLLRTNDDLSEELRRQPQVRLRQQPKARGNRRNHGDRTALTTDCRGVCPGLLGWKIPAVAKCLRDPKQATAFMQPFQGFFSKKQKAMVLSTGTEP